MRRSAHRGVRPLLLAAIGSLALVGTGIAGPPPVAETPATEQMRLGRDAVKAGKTDSARHHFLEAVAREPAHVPAWTELATLDTADADAKALWALGAAFATVDAAGKAIKSPLGPPFPNSETVLPLELATKRAGLGRAVAEAAGKLSGAGSVVVARWLRILADEVATGAALLGAPARAAADKAFEKCRPDATRVRAALETVLAEAKASGQLERALEAARLLVGFSAQKRGVLGPKAPIAEGFGPRHALDEVRAALRAKAGAPLAFAELDKLLASDKKVEFEEAHASWANPIVCESEKGRYVVESTCGLATTREAAALIEHCHDRLVVWCGRDPFDGRKGLVRVCPTDAELEQEGAPYWWAAGFAGADVITIAVHGRRATDSPRCSPTN